MRALSGSRVGRGEPATTRTAITAVFVDVGETSAVWERTLRVAPNPLDADRRGEPAARTRRVRSP